MVDYQRTLAREIEARLEAKCDALADLFAMDERGQFLNLAMTTNFTPCVPVHFMQCNLGNLVLDNSTHLVFNIIVLS
jgi:hypothetical protein